MPAQSDILTSDALGLAGVPATSLYLLGPSLADRAVANIRQESVDWCTAGPL